MEREKLNIDWGHNIQQVIAKAITQATLNGTEVETEFNGINVVVNSTTDQVALVRDFMNAHLMKWEEIGPNPPVQYNADVMAQIKLAKYLEEQELLKRQAEWDRQAAEKQADFDKSVEGVEMEVTDTESWNDYVKVNTDGYGKACVDYARNWARLMQKKMSDGAELKDIAGACSHLADTEGITGFMYGAAVSMLSKCWSHGEELRKWHNKEYNHEGEGVVNPAVITISSNDTCEE
jgi:hypothetical protein